MDIKNINKGFQTLLEGDVVSFADYKSKKNDNASSGNHIDYVIFNYIEGKQEGRGIELGKKYSYEEAQKLINELDYQVWNSGDYYGGYDKFDVTVGYTENGEQQEQNIRVDLGDGQYDPNAVNLKAMSDIPLDNADVPYDTEAYAQKYGTAEANMDKYVQDHKVEIPDGTDYSKKTIDEIEVGDIFYDWDKTDYGNIVCTFLKVVRKTKANVWLTPLKTEKKQGYKKVLDNRTQKHRIEDDFYFFPSQEEAEPKHYWLDYNKPFRLKSYNGGVLAIQKNEYFRLWDGKAIHESVEKVNNMSVKKMNEEFERMFGIE